MCAFPVEQKIITITSFIPLCRSLPLKELIIHSLSKTLAAAADAYVLIKVCQMSL
jgi:hypothetical protein